MSRPGGGDPDATRRAGRRVAVNTGVRAAAELVGKFASLLVVAGLARAEGQTGVGLYTFVFALGQLFLTPAELGLDRYMLRQVARDRERRHALFADVVVIKAILAVPAAGLCALVATLSADGALAVALFLGAGLVLDSLTRSVLALWNAHERGDLQARVLVTGRLAAAALGLLALALGMGVEAVAATYLVGTALALGQAVRLLRRVARPRWSVDRSRWAGLSRASIPFGVQNVLGLALLKLDLVLVGWIAGQAAAGRYGAAYRLIEATQFLVVAVSAAFVAMFAYLDDDSRPTLSAAYARSIKLVLLALLPCALLLGLLAEPICRLAFGPGFADAAAPLRLLAPVVVLAGVVTLSSSLLVSRSRTGAVLALTGAAVVLNIGLNVLLIPASGPEGAALAMLVTEVALICGLAPLIAGVLGAGTEWSRLLAGTAVAAAVMLVVTSALDQPVVAGVLGAAAYAGTFLLVERRVAPSEFEFVRDLLRRRGSVAPAAGLTSSEGDPVAGERGG